MASEEVFYSKSESFIWRMLEVNPVIATEMGEHRWDGRFGDNSLEALENFNREMHQTLKELAALDTSHFGKQAQIDRSIMVHLLKDFIRDHEAFARHHRDPGYYVNQVMTGLFLLIVKEFAPLPERLESLLSRLGGLARVLEDGKRNLVPSQVPKIWAEIALDQVKRTPWLLRNLIPSIAARGAPQLVEHLEKAGLRAAEAVDDFKQFLEGQILPKASGEFAAGRDLFNEMLSEKHMVDYDADELLNTGLRLFDETRVEMQRVASSIDPNRSVEEIVEQAKHDHPHAQDLLAAYERAVKDARQFVTDHEIVTIPENESLKIIPTPDFLRPLLPYAAYLPPGMLEDRQDGFFFVTPIDADAPPDVQEQKLRGHYHAGLPITALHEAYPGHHLQLVWANRSGSLPRRMASFLSSLFIEGWAFYCEELMEELGYIAKPIQKLGRLKDQLWRAARIILDVKLHTGQVSPEEAVDFLVEECKLEQQNAIAEVRRYTTSPTQPQSYLMGKLAILEIIDAYRGQRGELSLREIHDTILACGSLPPRLMRRCLLD